MLSSVLGDHSILIGDDDSQSEHEREFERWRTAKKIVQLLREAGFTCELSNDHPAIKTDAHSACWTFHSALIGHSFCSQSRVNSAIKKKLT
jgi:hypothetical protein